MRTTADEAFSVECVPGAGKHKPVVFVGEYTVDKRNLAKLIAAATEAAKWLESQR